MPGPDRSRIRLDRVLSITAAWLALAVLVALFEHDLLQEHGIQQGFLQRLDTRFLRTLVAGLLGGGLYVFVLRDRLRHLPFTSAFGIVAALMLLVMFVLRAAWPAWQRPDHFGPALWAELRSSGFLAAYLFWTLLAGATMFMVRLNDQYGNGGLSYLTGRYRKPRQEMRVFMFLDMRSSTTIAEKLGNVKYFRLLNELYTDITDPIVDARGEIYQYVGDEVSVSWPLRRGIGKQRCVRCFLAIRAKLERRERHYRERYGIAPTFKAGFHYGEVTTGEVGAVKKERIFSGDVVNTTARIQDMCNALGVDNLLSKELCDVLQLPSSYPLREIGDIALRGKRDTMSLWTLERAPLTAKAQAQRTEASTAHGVA